MQLFFTRDMARIRILIAVTGLFLLVLSWLNVLTFIQAAFLQFQRKGMSHEHAGLLLTEAINITVNVTQQPVFCLYLDASSAFDRAVRQILSRRMFLDGTTGHSLLYLDARLENRVT